MVRALAAPADRMRGAVACGASQAIGKRWTTWEPARSAGWRRRVRRRPDSICGDSSRSPHGRGERKLASARPAAARRRNSAQMVPTFNYELQAVSGQPELAFLTSYVDKTQSGMVC